MHRIILISLLLELHRILHIQNAHIIYDKASNSTEHTYCILSIKDVYR